MVEVDRLRKCENIVFSGGGVNGLLLIGAVKYLEMLKGKQKRRTRL